MEKGNPVLGCPRKLISDGLPQGHKHTGTAADQHDCTRKVREIVIKSGPIQTSEEEYRIQAVNVQGQAQSSSCGPC